MPRPRTASTILSAYRLFTGLGIGGMLAATNAIVAECSNARRRNLTVAIVAGGYPMGAIMGGLIATFLLAGTGPASALLIAAAHTPSRRRGMAGPSGYIAADPCSCTG